MTSSSAAWRDCGDERLGRKGLTVASVLCHDSSHTDMAPIQRSEKFQVRLTTEEREMLDVIAERDGLSASDKIRQLIRREFSLVAESTPKPKRKK